MPETSPFVLNIVSANCSTTATIGGTGAIYLIQDLASIFEHETTPDGHAAINASQTVTQDFLDNLNRLVDKYKDSNRLIFKFRDFFRKLQLDEAFYIIPGEQPKELLDRLTDSLIVRNDPDPQRAMRDLLEIKGQIKKRYNIYSYDHRRTVYIGEPDKNKRICRYCLRSIPETTFKQKAHTISESLGNKTIFTNTECDQCNNRYGSGIEKEFAEYLELFRALYAIRGKNGVISPHDGNYTVDHPAEKHITIGVTLSDEEIETQDKQMHESPDVLELPITTGHSFIPQNIYKALCKYILGILPDSTMPGFRSTVEWIDGTLSFAALPRIAFMFPTGFRLEQPRLTALVKHCADENLPKCLGIVEVADLAFAFIVPVAGDTVDYTDGHLLRHLADSIPPFNFTQSWQHLDYSSTTPQALRHTLRFVTTPK